MLYFIARLLDFSQVAQPSRGDTVLLAGISAGGAPGGTGMARMEDAAARAHLVTTRLMAKMSQEVQLGGMPTPSVHQVWSVHSRGAFACFEEQGRAFLKLGQMPTYAL